MADENEAAAYARWRAEGAAKGWLPRIWREPWDEPLFTPRPEIARFWEDLRRDSPAMGSVLVALNLREE